MVVIGPKTSKPSPAVLHDLPRAICGDSLQMRRQISLKSRGGMRGERTLRPAYWGATCRARTWRAPGAATTCDAPPAPPFVPARTLASPIRVDGEDVAPAECADGAQRRRELGHDRADIGANR